MTKTKKIIALILFSLVCVWYCNAAQELAAKSAKDKRAKVVETAKQYIGCPYQSGATGPERFDCSGLVYCVMRDAAGIKTPHSAKAIYSKVRIIKMQQIEEGDLVFFKTTGDGSISHVGIYIGKNQFIHAASAGSTTGVIISSLKEKYYTSTFAGVGQLLPSGNNGKEQSPAAQEQTIQTAQIKKPQEIPLDNDDDDFFIEEIIPDLPDEFIEE